MIKREDSKLIILKKVKILSNDREFFNLSLENPANYDNNLTYEFPLENSIKNNDLTSSKAKESSNGKEVENLVSVRIRPGPYFTNSTHILPSNF